MPTITPVPYQVLVKIFEKDGFTFARQSGDHLIYTKPGVNGRWSSRGIERCQWSSSRTCCGPPG
jgi:hypothetical protein